MEDVLGRKLMYISEVAGPIVEQSLQIFRPGDIGLLAHTRFEWMLLQVQTTPQRYRMDDFDARSR